MTILQLLNGEIVNCLQVNVLKKISSTQFIVGDKTGIAIMTTEMDATQHIELGKGLKMVKPSKIDENVISPHPKFSPMKTKAIQIDVDPNQLKNLEKKAMKIKKLPVKKGLNFKQIETDFGPTAIIGCVLGYVTFASRHIDGKFGPYQICNLVDFDGNSIAINLYKQNIDKLQVNKIYKLENIKKTTISTDTKLRMGTTPFTKIVVADQDEIDLFADVEISDKKVNGICLMFNNLSFYKSCKTHLLKLDDIGCCAQCGQIEKNDEKLDFRCSLVIHDSNDDSMVEIVIFLRHLNINFEKIQDETTLIEILEHSIVGKPCQIHYNENGNDNNVAVKVTIM